MRNGIYTVPFTYLSHDGHSRIFAQIWTCEQWGSGELEDWNAPDKPEFSFSEFDEHTKVCDAFTGNFIDSPGALSYQQALATQENFDKLAGLVGLDIINDTDNLFCPALDSTYGEDFNSANCQDGTLDVSGELLYDEFQTEEDFDCSDNAVRDLSFADLTAEDRFAGLDVMVESNAWLNCDIDKLSGRELLSPASQEAPAPAVQEASQVPNKLCAKEELANPKGIIQFVPGVAEHLGRYEDFARYLVSCGYLVCAHDHMGQGRSARDASDFGHMPLYGSIDALVGDMHSLRCIIQAQFPSTPYVVYGHSLGAFIARLYAVRYGHDLAACIFASAGDGPYALSRVGETLAHVIAGFKGENYSASFIDKLYFGSPSRKLAQASGPNDWLCSDVSVLQEYAADPLCVHSFSIGAYGTILGLINEVITPQWAQSFPSHVPVLFLAGGDDPLCHGGKGTHHAAQLLRNAGVRLVDIQIYPNKRHELHNEVGKEKFFAFVDNWIDAALL